jgi:L-lactate utilization protein LutC
VADRNEDGRITNAANNLDEARMLDIESFQTRSITLSPGLYVVQITQSQKVPDVHNYIAEAQANF